MSLASAILLLTLAVEAPTKPAEYEVIEWTGRVVLLAEALRPHDLTTIDGAPIASQVVLVQTDGTIHPLLSDPASRALFLDERLRNRPIRLQGRLYDGLPYVLVTSFQIEDEGVWRIPEYYCDVCAISVRFPQICPCCQGSMELRMRPEAP